MCSCLARDVNPNYADDRFAPLLFDGRASTSARSGVHDKPVIDLGSIYDLWSLSEVTPG